MRLKQDTLSKVLRPQKVLRIMNRIFLFIPTLYMWIYRWFLFPVYLHTAIRTSYTKKLLYNLPYSALGYPYW